MAYLELTQNQMNILEHTAYRAAGGFYCGDSTNMQVLVNRGLMVFAGGKGFVNDDYFKLTDLGRQLAAIGDNR
jgi:hypothetical protein